MLVRNRSRAATGQVERLCRAGLEGYKVASLGLDLITRSLSLAPHKFDISNTFNPSSTAAAHVELSIARMNCASSLNQHSENPSNPALAILSATASLEIELRRGSGRNGRCRGS